MRRIHHCLLAITILAVPMPVAAQVSVDVNALSRLGPTDLPAPPPASPKAAKRHHGAMRHLAAQSRHGSHHGAGHNGASGPTTAVADAAAAPVPVPAGPRTIEHPGNLGPSFASLPALPGAAPPVPAPPHVETAHAPPKPTAKPAPDIATATPTPPPPPPPPLALPVSVPPPPAPPAMLAETTPAPPAARLPMPQPAAPQPAAPNALPKGADRLTLPFSVRDRDLPSTENGMLRNFATRYGATTQYVVRAFASAPAGDDDPSTPRRISLARAQSVAAALIDSGVPPDRVRLLALGSAGGTPTDRVEVIAMPPSSGHTDPQSSP
jgi:hypothetical protein